MQGVVKALRKRGGKYYRRPPKKKRIWAAAIICLAVLLVAGAAVLMMNPGRDGVYRQLVRDGYAGTQEQWLASLVGENLSLQGEKTAYELAAENGYRESFDCWVKTIAGVDAADSGKSTYEIACENGFTGSLQQWLDSLADRPERLGKSGIGKEQTVYEQACEYGFSGSFTEWLVTVAFEQVES